MIKPTYEQLDIINVISEGNVVVNCAVGSGKSSSILFIAERYPNDKILLLTYNKRLKFETRMRANKRSIKNIETHSFHSFCVQHFDKTCFTDYGILNFLKNEKENEKENNQTDQEKYDMIIIDEAQDLNPLYYEIVCLINKKMTKETTKYCIIGDVYQSIYTYNNSDSRYILNADKLFNFNDLPWASCYLTETFRLTRNMTSFINNCIFGNNSENNLETIDRPNIPNIEKLMNEMSHPTLISNKDSIEKVRYIICDQFVPTIANDEIKYYLKKGYKYDDIFVLAPSVKSDKTPINILANRLTSQKIPIYCSVSEDDQLDSDIIAGKIVFCSYHQVKGLERKVVLVFGIDDSYLKYYKKDYTNINEIPSEMYVAITRSSECLTLFHHYKNDFLPFISKNYLKKYTELIIQKEIKLIQTDSQKKQFQKKQISISNLLRHIPVEMIAECMKFVETIEIEPKGLIINIPSKISQKYGASTIYENVSDINGIAIPCYYEFLMTGNYTIDNLINQRTHKTIKGKINKLKLINSTNSKELQFREESEKDETKEDNKINSTDLQKILYQSTKWSSISNGFIFKSNQISEYNWLTVDNISVCIERLKKWISDQAEYELFYDKLHNDYSLCGYIDCVDRINGNGILWEFKCVSEIDNVHLLQLALYMYITNFEFDKYRIFNILTNQILEIKKSNHLDLLVDKLLLYKKSNNYINSKKFIENNLQIREKYL